MKYLTSFTMMILLLVGNVWASQYKQALVCTDTRSMVLALANENPGVRGTTTLAVIMVMGDKQSIATLVSDVDGSTNLYYTSSAELIGTGKPLPVKDLIAGLIDLADDSAKKMKRVKTNSLPESNAVVYFVLTSSGAYRLQNGAKGLVNSSNNLAGLSVGARNVLDAMDFVEAQKQGMSVEESMRNNERTDMNCQLTILADAPDKQRSGSKVTIQYKGKGQDTEPVSAAGDNAKWIQLGNFDYVTPPASKTIKTVVSYTQFVSLGGVGGGNNDIDVELALSDSKNQPVTFIVVKKAQSSLEVIALP